MRILGLTPSEVADLAEQGIRLLVERCDIGKDCGYLTILDDVTGGGVMLICKIDICPPDKADRYFSFSQEKARRLHSILEHRSSFQSRDPENAKWGGAIRVGSLVISFSGLPELADEALMVFVAYRAGWIDKSEAQALSAISGNPHTAKIL